MLHSVLHVEISHRNPVTQKKFLRKVDFRNWKYATGDDGRLIKHETCNAHLDAVSQWKNYTTLSQSVLALQSSAHKQQVKKNRLYLRRVIDALLYLSRQGLAFRGNDETDESRNRGNFLELIDVISSVDPQFQQQCAVIPNNAKYTSAQIQDELLNIAANQIRSCICREANEARFIAVMVDESKDVTHKEQMSICVRYIRRSEMTVCEEFLSIEHLTALDATSLCSHINQALQSLGLTNCCVVAQCYDGASVMSGSFKGVQVQFRRTHECALYVHCHAHRLNLVIVSIAHQVKLASEFFALVEALYVFVTRQKVHEQFVLMQRERQLNVRELGRLSDTRWACRYRNVAVLMERLDTIIDVLCKVQETCDSHTTVEARGLAAQVKTVHFVTCLVVFNRILSLSNGVNETLQSSTLTIAEAEQLINSTITALTDLREHGWQDVWGQVQELCQKLGIDSMTVNAREKRKGTGKSVDRDQYLYDNVSGQRQDNTQNPVDYFRVELFLPVLDQVLHEMRRRFSQQTLAVTHALQSLLCPTSEKFLDYATVQPFLSHYGDTCGVVPSLLRAEMIIASDMIMKHRAKAVESEDASDMDMTAVITLLSQNPHAFTNLMTCIQIAMTIPVTSSSCERAFSSMKLLKNWLRNRTGDQRMSNLLTLYVCKERSRELDVDAIIDCFADQPGRRLTF